MHSVWARLPQRRRWIKIVCVTLRLRTTARISNIYQWQHQRQKSGYLWRAVSRRESRESWRRYRYVGEVLCLFIVTAAGVLNPTGERQTADGIQIHFRQVKKSSKTATWRVRNCFSNEIVSIHKNTTTQTEPDPTNNLYMNLNRP